MKKFVLVSSIQWWWAILMQFSHQCFSGHAVIEDVVSIGNNRNLKWQVVPTHSNVTSFLHHHHRCVLTISEDLGPITKGWGWGKEERASVRNDLFKINLKRHTFKMSQHIIRNIYKMPTLPRVHEDIVWKKETSSNKRGAIHYNATLASLHTPFTTRFS